MILAQGRDDIAGKVVLGATGVALAAGGVAAAVMLTSRKNRTTLKKAFSQGADKIQEYQHRIGIGKSSGKKGKSSKGRSSRSNNMPAVMHKIEMGKSNKRGMKKSSSSKGKRGRS